MPVVAPGAMSNGWVAMAPHWALIWYLWRRTTLPDGYLGRLARASVSALPFVSGSFDLVTSFEVLYHRAVLDVPQALTEICRVLTPGGHLLLRLPAYGWLMSQHDRSVHTRERYTAAQASALLLASGFVVEKISYCNSLLFPLALIERWSERWRTAAGADSAMTPPGPLLNMLLRSALEQEATLLAHGAHFPWGLSILALARKENHAA